MEKEKKDKNIIKVEIEKLYKKTGAKRNMALRTTLHTGTLNNSLAYFFKSDVNMTNKSSNR